jgi:hypothetical protein
MGELTPCEFQVHEVGANGGFDVRDDVITYQLKSMSFAGVKKSKGTRTGKVSTLDKFAAGKRDASVEHNRELFRNLQ